MAYKQLTEKGKSFIRNYCANNNKSLLSGKSSKKIKDSSSKLYNPEGVLPFCDPPVSPDKIWIASVRNTSGNLISTNQEFAELLIFWYDKYGKLYGMDANVMLAQAFQESGYYAWNYALTSTASGLCQFINAAVFDMVILNKHSNITPLFTQAEIDKITLNIIGDKLDYKNTYRVGNLQGKQNRPILHQNIIDNPEIMIKAQFRFMKYISSKCDGLASSTLFGYSRGPLLVNFSYITSINNATKEADVGGKPYEEEGIDYVYKIFKLLYTNFGYEFLNMGETPDPNFDKFNTSLA